MRELVFPYVYYVLIGYTWSKVFKKNYSEALPVATMFHVLVVIIFGMIFGKLSFGILGYIIICCIVLFGYYLKDAERFMTIREDAVKWAFGGGISFSALFVFCYVINEGKMFASYDEFSHWGMFLKESLRLDALYCTSHVPMAHKDYVPAFTMVEAIWIFLCGKYSESNAYRAIQIFCFIMMMPLFKKFYEWKREKKVAANSFMICILIMLITCSIPLLLNSSAGVPFYHSIYCDLPMGIVFFYCFAKAFYEDKCKEYQYLALGIAISFLSLCKMTGIALVPVIIGFVVISLVMNSEIRKADVGGLCLDSATSILLWYIFNKYVDIFYKNNGSKQSYDGMSIEYIKNVFGNDDSLVPYLFDVRKTYIEALFDRDILSKGSFIAVIIFVVLAVMLISFISYNNMIKIRICSIWMAITSLFYGLLMYFLYETAFSEPEARSLASYERYMGTFVISLVLIFAMLYIDYAISSKGTIIKLVSFLLLVVIMLAHDYKSVMQVCPPKLSKHNNQVEEYFNASELINSSTCENADIKILCTPENQNAGTYFRYYCCPRSISGFSSNTVKTQDDLKKLIMETDYIYILSYDDSIQKLWEGISDKSMIEGAFIDCSEILE